MCLKKSVTNVIKTMELYFEYFDRTITSFEKIGEHMNNLTEDGKIKKKIKRKGVGLNPPPTAIVSVLYASYLEYEEEPLDFKYTRKPYKFQLDSHCLQGFNYAILSMKVKEKSYFLIHPDYAFGKLGQPPRVTPNSVLLLRIELLQFSDSKPRSVYDKITVDQLKVFSGAYKLSVALMDNAKILMSKNVHFAIKEYQKAFKLLNKTTSKDKIEIEEQQKLKLRLLTNLAICYNKGNLPKKTCIMCNEIYKISKNSTLYIPAKVYFNNGRALFMIGDYKSAITKLLKAQKLEPNNRAISDEINKVNEKLNKEKEREKHLAKIYLESEKDVKRPEKTHSSSESNTSSEENSPDSIEMEVDNLFETVIYRLCTKLQKSNDTRYALPAVLTTNEYLAATIIAESNGLQIIIDKDDPVMYISKR